MSSSPYVFFTSNSSILTASSSSDVMHFSSGSTYSSSKSNFLQINLSGQKLASLHSFIRILTSLLYALKILVASSKVTPESGDQHAGDTGGNVSKQYIATKLRQFVSSKV